MFLITDLYQREKGTAESLEGAIQKAKEMSEYPLQIVDASTNIICWSSEEEERIVEKQYDIETLILEVTRNYNMSCAHCLRGPKQDRVMNIATIRAALKLCKSIDCIVFTGGEPLMEAGRIRKVLHLCKLFNIPVNKFFIATNGTYLNDYSLEILDEWQDYCFTCSGIYENYTVKNLLQLSEDDHFLLPAVAVSIDQFHKELPKDIKKILMSRPYFTADKVTDFKKFSVINRGNAISLEGYKSVEKPIVKELEIDDTWIETLYVDVNGNCFADCDLSYEQMDSGEFQVGSVFNPNNLE